MGRDPAQWSQRPVNFAGEGGGGATRSLGYSGDVNGTDGDDLACGAVTRDKDGRKKKIDLSIRSARAGVDIYVRKSFLSADPGKRSGGWTRSGSSLRIRLLCQRVRCLPGVGGSMRAAATIIMRGNSRKKMSTHNQQLCRTSTKYGLVLLT